MAKVFTGRDGTLRVGTADVAKVVNFSVQANLETLETTTLNENLRTYVPGVVGYTGSATLLYYKEDDGTFNTTALLSKIYKTGTSGISSSDTVELKFRIDDGGTNKQITMNAYVTSASFGAATGEIVRAEIAFQGTGKLEAVSIS
jgi:hypothetical protein